MKIFIVLASVVLAINASSDRELWQEFKANHGKTYRSSLEEQVRFGVFQKNLRVIEEHNEKFENNERSYTMAINQFADMSHEEFKNTILGLKRPELPANIEVFKPLEGFQAPSSVNWIAQGAVTPIKSQGNCGSCWAFSAVGALEGAYFLKTGQLVSFSEQDLIDCSTSYGEGGCDGGWMNVAFDFIKDNGISQENVYPYVGKDESCKNKEIFTRLSSYVVVPQNENALLEAVASAGPISVAIDADHFQFYSTGIFDDPACTHQLDHGVVVVGYGSENGQDFWIVKNSWGDQWGEQGYFRMARNHNNLCGIADSGAYPIV